VAAGARRSTGCRGRRTHRTKPSRYTHNTRLRSLHQGTRANVSRPVPSSEPPGCQCSAPAPVPAAAGQQVGRHRRGRKADRLRHGCGPWSARQRAPARPRVHPGRTAGSSTPPGRCKVAAPSISGCGAPPRKCAWRKSPAASSATCTRQTKAFKVYPSTTAACPGIMRTPLRPLQLPGRRYVCGGSSRFAGTVWSRPADGRSEICAPSTRKFPLVQNEGCHAITPGPKEDDPVAPAQQGWRHEQGRGQLGKLRACAQERKRRSAGGTWCTSSAAQRSSCGRARQHTYTIRAPSRRRDWPREARRHAEPAPGLEQRNAAPSRAASTRLAGSARPY